MSEEKKAIKMVAIPRNHRKTGADIQRMSETYWETEEFEEHINSAIICLSETNNIPKRKISKNLIIDCPFNRLFTNEDFLKLKSNGVYFAPMDRLINTDEIWTDIDDPPDVAAYSFGPSHAIGLRGLRVNSQTGKDPYLEIIFSRKIKTFPRGVVSFCPMIAKYKLSIVYGKEVGGVHGWSYYFGISEDGKIVPCDSGIKRDDFELIKMYAATVIGMECDKKYLWNVSTISDGVSTTVGVYESQIKSLLYARDLPMSETGRKRPILHWVASHRRRIKNGHDIDVKKYLRGISEFEMFGDKFTITNPKKQNGSQKAHSAN